MIESTNDNLRTGRGKEAPRPLFTPAVNRGRCSTRRSRKDRRRVGGVVTHRSKDAIKDWCIILKGNNVAARPTACNDGRPYKRTGISEQNVKV